MACASGRCSGRTLPTTRATERVYLVLSLLECSENKSRNSTTGAEARSLLNTLRGAEAPLFHVSTFRYAALKRRSSTSAHSATRR